MQQDGALYKEDFAYTLHLTDVTRGWAELAATPTKAQVHVFAALEHERAHLPFPQLGFHLNNGSEFINDELRRYCVREQVIFIRGRGGHKNDIPFC